MYSEEYYKNAEIFYRDIFYGMISISTWKGYADLLDYYAHTEPEIRKKYRTEQINEKYSYTSPKYERILIQLEQNRIAKDNEPIISVGEMFKVLNPRLYEQYSQIINLPAFYNANEEIKKLSKIIKGFEEIIQDLEDGKTIEEHDKYSYRIPEELFAFLYNNSLINNINIMKKYLEYYKNRFSQMNDSLNSNQKTYGHAFFIKDSKRGISKEYIDPKANDEQQVIYGNINDGIVLAHESGHLLTLMDKRKKVDNMNEYLFHVLLSETPAILCELFMADYYNNPQPLDDTNRLNKIKKNSERLDIDLKSINLLEDIFKQNKFGKNMETSFLLKSLKYWKNKSFILHCPFQKHDIGKIIANYIYEKIVEDIRNFKMIIAINMAISKGYLYRGVSFRVFKKLGIPIVDDDGRFSLNSNNVDEIIQTHNSYLKRGGPKHIDFDNQSNSIIPDSLFDEVEELYAKILEDIKLTNHNDGMTITDIEEAGLNHPVNSFNELLQEDLSSEEISRFIHNISLKKATIFNKEQSEMRYYDKDDYSFQELTNMYKFLPYHSVVFNLFYIGNTGENLLTAIAKFNPSLDEINSNIRSNVEWFMPKGDIKRLTKEEQRIFIYSNYSLGHFDNEFYKRMLEILDSLENQEWNPYDQLAIKWQRFNLETSAIKLLGHKRTESSQLAAELITGLGNLCESIIDAPFGSIFSSIEYYLQDIIYYLDNISDEELSPLFSALHNLSQNYQNNQFWKYGYTWINKYVETILARDKYKDYKKTISPISTLRFALDGLTPEEKNQVGIELTESELSNDGQ